MPMTLEQLIRRLSLRQLQVFLAVYQQQGYKKAGQVLGLTQPAVSAQIKQLEAVLNQPLFEYVGRKLYCTQAADRVAEAVLRLFSELENMQIDLTAMRGQLSGNLRLCAVSTAQYVVPHLLYLFKQLYPEVSVQVKVVNRSGALQRMQENQDDLVIMGMVPTGKPLVSMPFLDNELIPVMAKSCKLASKKRCTSAEFLQQPLLLREPGSGSRLAFEVFCQEKRLRFQDHSELGSNDALKHGVMAGLGVAVLPKLSVLPELATGLLLSPEIKGFPLRRSWCLVYPEGKHLSPVALAFLQYVQENLAQVSQYFLALEQPR